MCDCISLVNEQLKKHNTLLNVTFPFSMTGDMRVVLSTVKYDDKKRGRPKTMIASYCPICGEKYDTKKETAR